MADSLSHSERFGRFATLGARLDALDGFVGGGGAGWAEVLQGEDGAADIAATLATGVATVRIPPASPPFSTLNLPESGSPFFLVCDGVDVTATDLTVAGVEVDDPGLFAAGRWPDWDGTETFRFIPAPTASGWQAFPVPSAKGAPSSIFTVVIDTTVEGVPLWYLSD